VEYAPDRCRKFFGQNFDRIRDKTPYHPKSSKIAGMCPDDFAFFDQRALSTSCQIGNCSF
jgi:hypothetical protein